jgi:hypothetical protein
MRAGSGKSAARSCSTSSSVLGAPLAVFFFTGRPSRPNRISPICLGLAQVEGLAGDLVGLLLERHHALGQLPALAASSAPSISTPWRSMRCRIRHTGSSMCS